MDAEVYRADNALFEHRFWLQILGDHARFILGTLSPKEKTDIEKAQAFITNFDQLLEQARAAAPTAELSELNQEAYRQTCYGCLMR